MDEEECGKERSGKEKSGGGEWGFGVGRGVKASREKGVRRGVEKGGKLVMSLFIVHNEHDKKRCKES